MADQEIVIRLTVPEFVILDEFLRRITLHNTLAVEDSAEWQALCNLEALFEKEPSRGDDSWPTLEQARAAVRPVCLEPTITVRAIQRFPTP